MYYDIGLDDIDFDVVEHGGTYYAFHKPGAVADMLGNRLSTSRSLDPKVDSFAKALRQLPTILADNAGLDSADLVARLRKAVYSGMSSSGLDLMKPGGGIRFRSSSGSLVCDGLLPM